jgi:NAD(P)-dependent dehydrogenase (short-subunit alcohol dehydrogenase family)
MRLAGTTSLVTGAGSGIGLAIARRFAAEGARVIIVDIRGDRAAETARLIQEDGGEAFGIEADVSRADAVTRAV